MTNPPKLASGGTTPGSASELRQAGRVALDNGDIPAALEAFSAAVQLNASNAWSWLWLARAQGKAARYDEALVSLGRALACKPGMVQARLELISVQQAFGNRSAGIALARELRVAIGDDASLLRDLLRRVTTLDDPNELMQTALALLAIDAAQPDALAAQIDALLDLGSVQGAMALVEAHGAILPKAAIQEAALRELMLSGQPIAAFQLLSSWHNRFEATGRLEELSDQLWQEGHLLESMLALERAVTDKPHEAGLRQKRRERLAISSVMLDLWQLPDPPAFIQEADVATRVVLILASELPASPGAAPTETLLSLARLHRQAGLDVKVVTLLPHPWDSDQTDLALTSVVDGVTCHILVPVGPVEETLTGCLEATAHSLAGLIRRYQPVALVATETTGLRLLAALPAVAGMRIGLIELIADTVEQTARAWDLPFELAQRTCARWKTRLDFALDDASAWSSNDEARLIALLQQVYSAGN